MITGPMSPSDLDPAAILAAPALTEPDGPGQPTALLTLPELTFSRLRCLPIITGPMSPLERSSRWSSVPPTSEPPMNTLPIRPPGYRPRFRFRLAHVRLHRQVSSRPWIDEARSGAPVAVPYGPKTGRLALSAAGGCCPRRRSDRGSSMVTAEVDALCVDKARQPRPTPPLAPTAVGHRSGVGAAIAARSIVPIAAAGRGPVNEADRRRSTLLVSRIGFEKAMSYGRRPRLVDEPDGSPMAR